METPETNVKMAALKLLRHKALIEIANSQYPRLTMQDVNEVLIVAGLPVVMPDEIHVDEVDVIKTEKEVAK